MSGGEGQELEGDGRDKITRILSSMGADRFGECGQKQSESVQKLYAIPP